MNETTQPRQRSRKVKRGFRSAAAAARDQFGQALSKRGFAEPEVLLNWREIVGEDLAPACRPLRISYGRGPAVGATLVIEADGARATEIAHLAPRIIDKVNGFCGFRAVTRLKIAQTSNTGRTGKGRPSGFAEPAAGFGHRGLGAGEPDVPQPSRATLAEAEALAAGVEDPDLRATLTRLGAHVLSRAQARKD